MLLVVPGRKTATERKSYDARVMLVGPGTGILYKAPKQASKRGFLGKHTFERRVRRIWVFDSTELKGFVRLRFTREIMLQQGLGSIKASSLRG